MKYFLGLVALTGFSIVGAMPVMAQTESEASLFLAYPPPEHETENFTRSRTWGSRIR